MSDRHKCPAPGCTVMLPHHLFACAPHWRRLPGALKRDLNAEWRSGDIDAYLAAHKAASDWLQANIGCSGGD